MEMTSFSRSHLETLSTSDLVSLADEQGLDIPEGLNRRFIIGELLELTYDTPEDADSQSLAESDVVVSTDGLPESYNETRVTVLLRDPAWVFVYWDFQANLFTAITGNHHFDSFFLRVHSLDGSGSSKTSDFFDVDIGQNDRKWYVHLSPTDRACRVDLYSRNSQEKEQLLARSGEISIPSGYESGSEATQRRVPPLVELSGLNELRKFHARNHRQSL
jgi:uncharacterized protein